MAANSASKARLLFVLSNDFGELSNAMYLLRGQEFEAILLMPQRLFAINQDGLPVRTGLYAAIQDVLAAVDREKPDVVFLFSGYLFVANRIFSIEDLEKLVQELHARGCRIVTSDPFLGVLSKLGPATFGNHPLKQWLMEHFTKVFGILKPIKHLYLVNPDGLADTDNISFYNPHIVMPPSAVNQLERTIQEGVGADPSRKRWLFVLSHEDYGYQMGRHGKPRFDDMLADMLRQTVREGRQPVLVGPSACIPPNLTAPPASLPPILARGPAIEGLIPLAFCRYDLFLALLFEAEYVFYWNIFSNSVPARAVNRLPVFFFDRGHMAHAITPLFEVGVPRYYPNSEVPYLDAARPLAAPTLASLAAQQERALSAAVSSFRQSPTPLVMVEQLLQHEPDA